MPNFRLCSVPELWKVNREKLHFRLLSLSAGSGKGDDVVRHCEQRKKEKGGQRGEKGKWGGLIHLLFKGP